MIKHVPLSNGIAQLYFQGFQQDRPSDRYNFTTVTIHVEDIDANPPVMAHSSYSTAIMENTENGVEVLQVAASDPDTVRTIFIKMYRTFRIQKIFLSSESCKSNKQTNA